MSENSLKHGTISQIIGAVIDVKFDTQGQDAKDVLPRIHEALEVTHPDGRKSSSKCSNTLVRIPCVP